MNRPRNTPWWQRLKPRHSELWKQFLDDPQAHPELYRLVQDALDQCAAAHVLMEAGSFDDAQFHVARFGTIAARITLILIRLSPELTHFYGDQLGLAVGHYVEGQVLRGLYGPEVAVRAIAEAEPLYMRGVPGTSIRLTADRTIEPPTTSSKELQRELMQLGEMLKSYLPEGQPGRRRGPAARTEAEARQAVKLADAGGNWQDIARALWGKRPDRTHDVYYEAIRRRVSNRVSLGRKLQATN